MSLAQQLLLRALSRASGASRTTARLDALGHRAARSLHAAVLRLAGLRGRARRAARAAGFALDAEWFAPHFEFRFPRYGDVAVRGIAADAAPGARAVARAGRGRRRPAARRATSIRRSSACRCWSRGLTPRPLRRHLQRPRVPLQPTGRNGEYVAGVRYRAWQPPRRCIRRSRCTRRSPSTSSTPGWSARSAAASITSMHPGGRSYEHFPVNSHEAESRRLARFSRLGHTPGRCASAPASADAEFPYHARPADA